MQDYISDNEITEILKREIGNFDFVVVEPGTFPRGFIGISEGSNFSGAIRSDGEVLYGTVVSEDTENSLPQLHVPSGVSEVESAVIWKQMIKLQALEMVVLAKRLIETRVVTSDNGSLSYAISEEEARSINDSGRFAGTELMADDVLTFADTPTFAGALASIFYALTPFLEKKVSLGLEEEVPLNGLLLDVQRALRAREELINASILEVLRDSPIELEQET